MVLFICNVNLWWFWKISMKELWVSWAMYSSMKTIAKELTRSRCVSSLSGSLSSPRRTFWELNAHVLNSSRCCGASCWIMKLPYLSSGARPLGKGSASGISASSECPEWWDVSSPFWEPTSSSFSSLWGWGLILTSRVGKVSSCSSCSSASPSCISASSA